MIVVVEAYHDEQKVWKLIQSYYGDEEDDVMEEAKAKQQEWLDEGWPKDQIRVVKQDFQTFKKKTYREDD